MMRISMSTLPAIVQMYNDRRCSTIPMSRQKRPLVRWKQYQTSPTNRDDLLCWLDEFGDRICGWARITGRLSGEIVLDDDRAGWMERLGLSPHVRTGSGGFHWIGRHPGWPVKTVNSRSSRRHTEHYPGLDVRGDGGYSVVAGFNERGGYTWLREPVPDPLDLLPRDLREFFGLLAPPPPTPNRPAASLPAQRVGRVPAALLIERALAEARASGRNNGGFWLVMQLRDNGYNQGEALQVGAVYVGRTAATNMKGDAELYTLREFEGSVRQAYGMRARDPWTPQRSQLHALPPLVRPTGAPLPRLNRPRGVSLPQPIRPTGVEVRP